jgi:hypothetical protein
MTLRIAWPVIALLREDPCAEEARERVGGRGIQQSTTKSMSKETVAIVITVQLQPAYLLPLQEHRKTLQSLVPVSCTFWQRSRRLRAPIPAAALGRGWALDEELCRC